MRADSLDVNIIYGWDEPHQLTKTLGQADEPHRLTETLEQARSVFNFNVDIFLKGFLQ